MSDHTNLDLEKIRLRKEIRSRRRIASANLHDAPAQLAERFFESYAQDIQDIIIAGYCAVGSEISLEPIFNLLSAQRVVCA